MERMRLLAISWAMLPMSAPRAMQVSRLLASVDELNWECDVVTSAQSANPEASTAEHGVARLYEGHYKTHVVGARQPALSRLLAGTEGFLAADERASKDPWVDGATSTARKLLRQKNHDALVTFAQPWVDHLIGLRLKQAQPALPWLAHFSDPWVDSPYMESVSPSEMALMAEQERSVILAADAIVFVTREAADLVMRKYDSQLGHKVHVLPHCLDLRALPMRPVTRGEKRKLKIVHAGSLYGGRRPASGLLEALAQLNRKDGNLPIELQFVGHNPETMQQDIVASGLQDITSVSAPCAWSESLAIASTADVLLVIDRQAELSVFLPSKAVEYLALDRPIFALTPDLGATANLMRDLGYRTAPPDDPAKIAICLERMIQEWRAGGVKLSQSHAGVVERYKASRVAMTFTKMLRSVIETTRDVSTIGLSAPLTYAPANVDAGTGLAMTPAKNAAPPTMDETATYRALLSILRAVGDKESKIVLVLIQRIPTAELDHILAHPRVASIMINWEDPGIQAHGPDRVGSFRYGSSLWALPRVMAHTLAIVGYVDSLGVRRIVDAIKQGVRQIIVQSPYAASWQVEATPRLLVRSLVRRFQWSWGKSRLGGGKDSSLSSLETNLSRKLHESLKEACASSPGPAKFVANRIVLVSASLDAGGAERQVVNTAASLVGHGIREVSILCRSLSTASMEFFRPFAEQQGVMVSEISRFIDADLDDALTEHRRRLPRILHHLPSDLASEVLALVAELVHRRPQVVHAWQDYINVIAGLAAVIAGVPRIILGGRSVAPYNFVFHEPFMRGAYQALVKQPNVLITNNSRAGAADYAQWLDVPVRSIRVVHNGYDFEPMQRRPKAVVDQYRKSLGIEPGAAVVGTIMRFSEEKRPLLWVEAMAIVARKRPHVTFVMIGAGIMHEEAMRLASALGIERQIVMPGIERDAILALSIMDLFVLTSRKEGLPNTLIEAQAVGVPVIAIDAGGAREAFKPGVTGRVVAEGTAEAVAREVLGALEDRQWYAEASTLAPKYVRNMFSQERLVRGTLDLYELRGNRPRIKPPNRHVQAGG